MFQSPAYHVRSHTKCDYASCSKVANIYLYDISRIFIFESTERCTRDARDGLTIEICNVHDYGMIDEDVTLGQSTARTEKKGAAIKQIDSRCESGIGTEIIHGMNYLETGAT